MTLLLNAPKTYTLLKGEKITEEMYNSLRGCLSYLLIEMGGTVKECSIVPIIGADFKIMVTGLSNFRDNTAFLSIISDIGLEMRHNYLDLSKIPSVVVLTFVVKDIEKLQNVFTLYPELLGLPF